MSYFRTDGIPDTAPNNLEGIGLENFRTFKEYSSLNFSSINLITGVNGSGKSSIFKAILLLKDSLQHKESEIHLDFLKQEHLLGTFNNVVTDKSKNIKISIPMPLQVVGIKNTYIMFDFEKKSDSLAILKKLVFLDNEVPLITLNKRKPSKTEKEKFDDNNRDDFPIDVVDVVYLESIIDYEIDTQQLEIFNQKIKKVHKAIQEIFKDDVKYSFKEEVSIFEQIDQRFTNLDQKIANFNKNSEELKIPKKWNTQFYKKDLKAIDNPQNGQSQSRCWEDGWIEFKMLNVLEEVLARYCYIENSIIQKQLNKTLAAFSKVSHLSSIRGINSRLYHFDSNNAFVKLLHQYNEDTFEKNFIDRWLKNLNIGESISIKKHPEFQFYDIKINVIKNKENVPTRIIDFGYGIIQIITLLIQIGIQASKYQERYYKPNTIIIEEPEANLHPNWQSKLAELIIEANHEFNTQFLIETHSEYLICKFQELIANRKIRPTNVALYYLNHPDSDKKYVNRVPINEDGSIEYEKYFGTGFFDEQTNLKLSLLNIQRDRFLDLFQKTKANFAEDDTLSDEEQLKQLDNLIDSHFEKLDFSTHEGFVKTQFPNFARLLPKSINYLASGYHLFTIIGDNDGIADYSPAVLQFGRAVENEIHQLFKEAKDGILTNPSYSTYLTNHASQDVNLTIGDNNFKRQFKSYINQDISDANGKKYKITFGNMRQVFEQLNQEPLANIQNVDLLNALYDYLTNQYFNNWSSLNVLIPTLANIVDLRNQSAHTYANPISRANAFDYKVEVENWLRAWSDEIR